MGQSASTTTTTGPAESTTSGGNRHHHEDHRSHHIRELISYARTNYQENPTESLAALMEALTINGGEEAAHQAMERLRTELGDDIANHVGRGQQSHHQRMERAVAIIDQLLRDETTELYRQGRQDILRQTVEDGSSVVCSRCMDVVASGRWQQHQQYWCRANNDSSATTVDNTTTSNTDDRMMIE